MRKLTTNKTINTLIFCHSMMAVGPLIKWIYLFWLVGASNESSADIKTGQVVTDLFKPYQYVREINCLTNFLDYGCFATQNLVRDKNQFGAKILQKITCEASQLLREL